MFGSYFNSLPIQSPFNFHRTSHMPVKTVIPPTPHPFRHALNYSSLIHLLSKEHGPSYTVNTDAHLLTLAAHLVNLVALNSPRRKRESTRTIPVAHRPLAGS
jgi:hypothetical protein